MNNLALYTKISTLPYPIKSELLDYIDFLIQKYKPRKIKKHPKAGCMHGTFKMTQDFDTPIDDFKEYME